MNLAPQSTPSTDDIKQNFPFPQLTKIIGEPTYENIRKLETQMIRNAASIEITINLPHNNLLGLVEQAQVYLIRTGAHFP